MKKEGAKIDPYHYECYWHDQGKRVIAGVDEAGRGPLAGPVVVAGVILPYGERLDIGIDDSKAMSERQREAAYELLTHDERVRWCVSVRGAEEIDRVNILRATHNGMREVVERLGSDVDMALVDGLRVPSFPVPADFIVKGDALSASIGAASILAKVTRDRLMVELDVRYPGYGFGQHKGYGTAAHLAALKRLGACPEHRRSFAPVARVLGLLPEAGEQLEFKF